MIKRKEGICYECGKEGTLFRSSPPLCYYHELQYKKKKYYEKQKAKGKSKYKPRKRTGEMDVFIKIWNERKHVSEVSGDPLGNVLKPIFFSHVLTKGAYPSLRLNKENIILMTADEHQLWEFGKDKIKDDPKWKWVFERRDKLKREYYDSKEI